MAEALFRYYWFSAPCRMELNIASAGIHAFNGDGATAEVRELLQRERIDASGHRARRLSDEMIRHADLIIVMTSSHYDSLVLTNPAAEQKIRLLKEFSGEDQENLDIADPYGSHMEMYEYSLQEIKESVLNLINKIDVNEIDVETDV